MALRLELQKTVSHRIGSAAVSDLSGCYKLIVFDLFDACDCQGTYNVPPHSMPNILSIQETGVIMYVSAIARGSLIQTVWSISSSGLFIFSLVCSVRCGRTVCWHVCVFVQPRFSSSTECIYRTTPSNPNHSKVACTDTQAICFPIMFLCDSVERALKQRTEGKQCVFCLFFFLLFFALILVLI